MIRTFKWERWKDPLDFKVEDIVEEDCGEDIDLQGKPIKMLQTPFGMLPVTNNLMASKSFDLWILHTNFDITKPIAQIINAIPGVETLEVLTRYRIRVGFPNSNLFNVREVKSNIEERILHFFQIKDFEELKDFDDQTIRKSMEVRDYLNKKYKYWTLLVLPNGNMEVITSDKYDVNFESKIDLLDQIKLFVGGAMLTSEGE